MRHKYKRVAKSFKNSPSRTIQSGKADADINVIVRRFGLTGQVKPNNLQPFYGDFSEVEDYQDAHNRLVAARESFQALPSDVRERFANDPGNLIRFVNDGRNLEEARRLGLMRPVEPAPEPMAVRVVPDPKAPPAGGQGASAPPA